MLVKRLKANRKRKEMRLCARAAVNPNRLDRYVLLIFFGEKTITYRKVERNQTNFHCVRLHHLSSFI